MNATAQRASYNVIGGPEGLLATLQPFNGNSMYAQCDDSLATFGRLPSYASESFCNVRTKRGVRYVVISYSTPIAWVSSDNLIYVPDVKYSSTTSRHQGLCRAWLDWRYDLANATPDGVISLIDSALAHRSPRLVSF